MNTAVRGIPPHRHRSTRLAFKATAGLRRIGAERAERTLQAVRHFLEGYAWQLMKHLSFFFPAKKK